MQARAADPRGGTDCRSQTTLMRVLALLLLLGSASAAHSQTHAVAPQRYSVDRWTIEDGLPNNTLADLMVARDGYLWIATLAGMQRFDGVRFTTILESLPNAHA